MRRYTVKQGDTLGHIAERFGFDNDDPILRYNTLIEHNIRSGDPNRIDVGTDLGIPRTFESYEKVARELQGLRQAVLEDGKEIEGELGVIKKESDDFAGDIDLAGELATLTVTGTAQVVKLGSKRLAKLLIRKKALKAGQLVLAASLPDDDPIAVVIDKGTGAVADNSLFILAERGLRKAKTAESFAKGMATSYAKKAAIYTTRAIMPVEHANGMAEMVTILSDLAIGAGQAIGKSGMDIAGAAVSALSPSNIAKGYLWATSEHPDDTNRKAVEHVRRVTQSSLDRLSKAISRLQAEKAQVYPSGAGR